MCDGVATVPGSAGKALRMAHAALDYLASPAGRGLDPAAIGEVLVSLGVVQAKFTAAQAGLLRRFDAAGAHDSDGYGSTSAWLAGKAQMTRTAAKAAVQEMRMLGRHGQVEEALAGGGLSRSLGLAFTGWTKDLPADLRDKTEAILIEAAAAGAGQQDLATIAAAALERWRSGQPGPGEDGDFEDRYLHTATTFGGAGVIRGDLTPQCAAAVQAVLDALGKKQGPEDTRSQGQRFHDALQLGCELLIRAKMIPDRAGAGTQVMVHAPLSALRREPGASRLEAAYLAARLGEPGYLTGTGAQTAACDALIIPVVTGHADPTVIDTMIELVLAHAGIHPGPASRGTGPDTGTGPEAGPCDGTGTDRPAAMSPQAYAGLRHALATLAIDFVSGPNGLASYLRTGLLQAPYNTPSLPLDIGYSDTIPAHIRRAVTLRDKHCAWPGCDKPVAHCDVHHIAHKKDGGKTSVGSCLLLCGFHHDVCVHRWGWQIILHPDGSTEARSPDGRQILRSHAPPTARAG